MTRLVVVVSMLFLFCHAKKCRKAQNPIEVPANESTATRGRSRLELSPSRSDGVFSVAEQNGFSTGNPALQGDCPGFRNVVFNTKAARNSGWPGKTWDTLTQRGVSNWSM